MREFAGPSANHVWQDAASALLRCPEHIHNGRNGPTREFLQCLISINDPRDRWIPSRHPAYNPAFGLVEFISILAGNNTSTVLKFWNPTLPLYSGSGEIFPGAYGHRLRHEFGFDQLYRAYQALSVNPETRQVVLQIWKADVDMPDSEGRPTSADIPCNVVSLLKVREGRLYWTQIMRSNDILRGLPYNIIQFTMLQELMAGWLGCELGDYCHWSDSLHAYERDLVTFRVVPAVTAKPDKERFDLSFSDTHKIVERVYADLSTVAQGHMSEKEIQAVFARENVKKRFSCERMEDVMAVIGSDAARRCGFTGLSIELAESCNERALRAVALAWLNQMDGAT